MLNKVSNFPICLAPMVGLSHVSMREALRHYVPKGAKVIWPTEMLSSYKLPNKKLHNISMSKRAEGEEGLVPQILGNEKTPIEKSIQVIRSWGAVGVDMNMGCPVKKALKHNYGVSLMGDPKYAAEVTSYAVKASDLPVSVKFRAGMQKDLKVLEDFSYGIQEAGAAWVTLHPRTAAQKRRGRADWSQIAHLKNKLSIPVIGNGDVQNIKDYYQMKEETGCDQVMIGRGLTIRPWLFWQLSEDMGLEQPEHLAAREAPRTGLEEGAEFGRFLLILLDQLYFYNDEKEALKQFRFYLRVAHPWLMFGHDLARKSTVCFTKEDCVLLVKDFFSRPQKISQSTLGTY